MAKNCKRGSKSTSLLRKALIQSEAHFSRVFGACIIAILYLPVSVSMSACPTYLTISKLDAYDVYHKSALAQVHQKSFTLTVLFRKHPQTFQKSEHISMIFKAVGSQKHEPFDENL